MTTKFIPTPGTPLESDVVKREHPLYPAQYNLLRFYREAYEGSGAFAPWTDEVRVSDTVPDDLKDGSVRPDDNRRTALQRHPREGKKFLRRVMQAHPTNKVKSGVQMLSGYLTKQQPTYDDYPTAVKDWMDKVNATGDTWETFKVFELVPKAMYYGRLPVLHYRPLTDAVTVAQQEEQGGTLTATVINPENVVDWHWGDNDEYTWLKVRSKVDLSSPLDEEKSVIDRYWYYTQDGWWYIDDNGDKMLPVVASGAWDHGLPIVTWSMLDGIALTADASATQRELYNVSSLVQEQERETAFAMLAMPDPGEEMRAKVMQGGSDNVLWVDRESSIEAKWLTPDTAVLEHFMAKRNELMNEIMSALGLDFDEGGGQTGMAFQFKMSKIDRLIQSLAEAFSRSESRSLQRVGLELGSPVDDKVRVKWPKEFDARDTEKEQDAAERVLDRVGSAAAREDAQYKIAIAGNGQQDEARRKLYRKEIEESVEQEDLDADNARELAARAAEAAARGETPGPNDEDADDLQADGGSR
jgi:hypothetical protein